MKTNAILNQIGGPSKYCDFVGSGVDEKTLNFYKRKHIAPIFGSQSFKIKIKGNIARSLAEESLPDLKRTIDLPKISTIMTIACQYFKVDIYQLMNSKRGEINLPRLLGIYLSRNLGLHTYKNIAKHFSSLTPGGVRSALRRFATLLKEHPDVNEILRDLIDRLSKIQGRT